MLGKGFGNLLTILNPNAIRFSPWNGGSRAFLRGKNERMKNRK